MEHRERTLGNHRRQGRHVPPSHPAVRQGRRFQVSRPERFRIPSVLRHPVEPVPCRSRASSEEMVLAARHRDREFESTAVPLNAFPQSGNPRLILRDQATGDTMTHCYTILWSRRLAGNLPGHPSIRGCRAVGSLFPLSIVPLGV